MLEGAKKFGRGGRNDRMTTIEDLPEIDTELLEVPVERSPATVICSQKGWIRVVRGNVENGSDIRYKEGDRERFVIAATTADKLLAVSDDGRCYLLEIDKLPSGRGLGEPVSLFIELAQNANIIALFVHRPDRELMFATEEGRGFRTSEQDVAAQTRAGRQVVNVADGDRLIIAKPIEGDYLAIVGTNSRLIIFAVEELPQMSRGRGVILQRYRDGKLADVTSFDLENGLSWEAGSRIRNEKDVTNWVGKRGGSGRLVPIGFPKSRLFGRRY